MSLAEQAVSFVENCHDRTLSNKESQGGEWRKGEEEGLSC
jgi:hypothetical protein